jgi:hypothetical protein
MQSPCSDVDRCIAVKLPPVCMTSCIDSTVENVMLKVMLNFSLNALKGNSREKSSNVNHVWHKYHLDKLDRKSSTRHLGPAKDNTEDEWKKSTSG